MQAAEEKANIGPQIRLRAELHCSCDLWANTTLVDWLHMMMIGVLHVRNAGVVQFANYHQNNVRCKCKLKSCKIKKSIVNTKSTFTNIRIERNI